MDGVTAAHRSAQARAALPSAEYTSTQALDFEMERIFRPGWHCVGREDTLAQRGRFLCAAVLGKSIIVVRDSRNELQAFANSCRHRGMRLVEPGVDGSTSGFTCPYHAWTYALDGRLIGAPYMGGPDTFDRGPLSLERYAVATWRGWVFVSLAAQPAPFNHSQSGLDALMAPYRPEQMRTVFRVQETWNTNWKLLVENFIESYHLFHVHRETLEPRTPTSSVVCGEGDGSFCYHRLTERPGVRKFVNVDERLPEEYRYGEVLACMFPAHLVSVTANLLVWLSLCPAGPGAVSITGGLSAHPDYLSEGFDRQASEAQLRRDFDAFNAEDRFILERLFLSHASGAVRPGPLCPLEHPLQEFHAYLQAQCAA